MKRVFTCVGGLLLSFAFVSAASAGAIDNKTNWSAEYIRTLNRNAATDYADIAAYNPAGTVKLQDGLTINGSVQYLGKKYTNNITLPGPTLFNLESDEPSYVPSLFAVYNKDFFSIFGAVTIVGGGGKVDFSQGSATTMAIALPLVMGGAPYCPPGAPGTACVNLGTQQLTAESFYKSFTLGSAFEVNDMFSFSVGIRYVDAYKEAQGSATVWDAGYTNSFSPAVSYEQEGTGWGGILGINMAPNDQLNIGMRYESRVNLELEATVITDTLNILPGIGINPLIDASRDLPALFAIGVSYWLTEQLRLETNYTHYFNQDADWNGAENYVDDGYDVGIAIEYHFTDSFLGSLGYLRTETGIDPDHMLPENPELDANTVGGGIAFAVTENLHTNLALGYVFYEDDSFANAPLLIEYEKAIIFVAVGMEYRF